MLARRPGQPFTEARNHFEAQGTRDSLVELSGVLRTIAVGLTKICNDLRWMSSGPTTGLAEIHLPDLQPGSSIMPGKVNPVLPEATLMVCFQVIGNDAAVTVGRRERQLRAQRHDAGAWPATCSSRSGCSRPPRGCSPTAASTASPPTPTGCGTTPSRHRRSSRRSTGTSATRPPPRSPSRRWPTETTIREIVLALGYVERGELTEEQLDEALDVESMTHP